MNFIWNLKEDRLLSENSWLGWTRQCLGGAGWAPWASTSFFRCPWVGLVGLPRISMQVTSVCTTDTLCLMGSSLARFLIYALFETFILPKSLAWVIVQVTLLVNYNIQTQVFSPGMSNKVVRFPYERAVPDHMDTHLDEDPPVLKSPCSLSCQSSSKSLASVLRVAWLLENTNNCW